MCVCTSPFVKNSNYSLTLEHIVIVDILSVFVVYQLHKEGMAALPMENPCDIWDTEDRLATIQHGGS